MPDNDPLESLDNFPEGLHVDSLPASEVRRRGDRMRRRNTALATVGGVVAAAVFIGTPVALMSGNDDDSVDPPTVPADVPEPTTPSAEWLTEIPAEFPLADGLTRPPAEVRPRSSTPTTFSLCDTSYPTARHRRHARHHLHRRERELRAAHLPAAGRTTPRPAVARRAARGRPGLPAAADGGRRGHHRVQPGRPRTSAPRTRSSFAQQVRRRRRADQPADTVRGHPGGNAVFVTPATARPAATRRSPSPPRTSPTGPP